MIAHARRLFAPGLVPAAVLLALMACSREPSDEGLARDLAEQQAEADAASEVSFAGGELPACTLLAQAEVEAVLGPLRVPPHAWGDAGPEHGGGACAYRAAEGRMLVVRAASGDAAARLAELDTAVTAQVEGTWDEAAVVGCCELHAVRGDVLVSIDGSRALLDLARIGALMSRALQRTDAPLAVDADDAVDEALALAREEAAR